MTIAGTVVGSGEFVPAGWVAGKWTIDPAHTTVRFAVRHLMSKVHGTGLAFLPTNLLMAAVSVGVSARLVARFGIKPPLVTGLLLAAAGQPHLAALTGGYHTAYLIAAACTVSAAVLAATWLRPAPTGTGLTTLAPEPALTTPAS
jgi:hypothetical protein